MGYWQKEEEKESVLGDEMKNKDDDNDDTNMWIQVVALILIGFVIGGGLVNMFANGHTSLSYDIWRPDNTHENGRIACPAVFNVATDNGNFTIRC
jgi:hypothetical protein